MGEYTGSCDSCSDMAAAEPKRKRTRNQELARLWLTKGGVFHEDSDDELGCEDLPWEWIYEESGDNSDHETPKKPGRQRSKASLKKKIIGARMGSFECRLGEVILLKSPEPGKDWAGIICEFLEEKDEDGTEADNLQPIKSANLMWFASPDEFISTKNKKRSDALPNEQYITKDFNINPLTSINGKANILSKEEFYKIYPEGKPPKGKEALSQYNKCIICRRGVNQLQGKYTEEFIWEDIYKQSEQGVFDLIEIIKTLLKGARKRKGNDTEVSSDGQSASAAPN